jgi:hypothetical protein
MKKLRVIYDPEFGAAVPDGQVKDYVNRLISTCYKLRNGITISIGCESIIFQLRIAVKQGTVPSDMQIIIVWEGVEYPVGPDGMFHTADLDGVVGKRFCDFQLTQMGELF